MTGYDEGDETQDCCDEGFTAAQITQAQRSYDLRDAVDAMQAPAEPLWHEPEYGSLVRMEAFVAGQLREAGVPTSELRDEAHLRGIAMSAVLAEIGPDRAATKEPLIRDAVSRMWQAIDATRKWDASLKTWREAA